MRAAHLCDLLATQSQNPYFTGISIRCHCWPPWPTWPTSRWPPNVTSKETQPPPRKRPRPQESNQDHSRSSFILLTSRPRKINPTKFKNISQRKPAKTTFQRKGNPRAHTHRCAACAPYRPNPYFTGTLIRCISGASRATCAPNAPSKKTQPPRARPSAQSGVKSALPPARATRKTKPSR